VWRDRILKGPLVLDDVRMSKQLTKPVGQYRRKEKKDGGMSALPVHVEVAVQLAERGLDVGEGVRIEYVVVDGKSPLKAIPADDYDGDVDRFYLWENLVYPPSQRVLDAAFPGHKWRDYLRVRPFRDGRHRTDILGQALLF
jgi:DNA polymerase elongation subunit (family B)